MRGALDQPAGNAPTLTCVMGGAGRSGYLAIANLKGVTMQILIPVDFSDTSARSLRFAYALNLRFTAQLQVLHIFDVPITSGDDGEVYLRNYEAYRKSFEDELWDFVNRNKDGQHFDTEVFATSGGHYQGIVSFARSHRPDLIVVGHKGAGRVARWMFGSVSRYLLTHPPAPVLSIPGNLPEGANGFRKILLAADLSAPLPEAQMAFLKGFAEKQQAELGLLHVRVDGEIPAPDEARTVTGLTRALGARCEERTLGKGEGVAGAILSHLHEKGYDLLVTVPHRHTWIDSLLMGSETRRIANVEDIAVLALPEK